MEWCILLKKFNIWANHGTNHASGVTNAERDWRMVIMRVIKEFLTAAHVTGKHISRFKPKPL